MTAAVITFDAACDFNDDGETIVLNPARPSKMECIALGFSYFEHVANEKALNAMLDEHGPVLIRRSLRAFANYANRTGDKAVAKFVEELREDIVVVRASHDEQDDEESAAV